MPREKSNEYILLPPAIRREKNVMIQNKFKKFKTTLTKMIKKEGKAKVTHFFRRAILNKPLAILSLFFFFIIVPHIN